MSTSLRGNGRRPPSRRRQRAVRLMRVAQRFPRCLDGQQRLRSADALDAIASGRADLVAFGRSFISNPDLVRRLREKLPLNEPRRATGSMGAAPTATSTTPTSAWRCRSIRGCRRPVETPRTEASGRPARPPFDPLRGGRPAVATPAPRVALRFRVIPGYCLDPLVTAFHHAVEVERSRASGAAANSLKLLQAMGDSKAPAGAMREHAAPDTSAEIPWRSLLRHARRGPCAGW